MVEILCKQSCVYKYVIHTIKYTINDIFNYLLSCQIDMTFFRCFEGDSIGFLRLTLAFDLVYEFLGITLN